MPTVLICGPDRLMDELRDTMLARDGVDRIHVHGVQQAFGMAVAARPELVVVDRDVPMAERLVEDLRDGEPTRTSSIVVAARGDLDPAELHLIEVGANALLRLPGGPDADARLARLMDVAPRRAVRLPVSLQADAFHLHGETSMPALVVNLSVHGMLVHCTTRLTVGDELRFALPLTDHDVPVRGTAHVVRAAGDDGWGLAFEALEDDGVERVRRHVEG